MQNPPPTNMINVHLSLHLPSLAQFKQSPIMMHESNGHSDRNAWILSGVVTALGAAVIFGYQFSGRSPTDTNAVPQNNPVSTQQNSVTTAPHDVAASTESSDYESASSRYICEECGQSTENPPDIGGEVLCSTCLAYYKEKNRRFVENYNAGTATKCEWCNGYAPSGKGVCDSCMRKIAAEISRMK